MSDGNRDPIPAQQSAHVSNLATNRHTTYILADCFHLTYICELGEFNVSEHPANDDLGILNWCALRTAC